MNAQWLLCIQLSTCLVSASIAFVPLSSVKALLHWYYSF